MCDWSTENAVEWLLPKYFEKIKQKNKTKMNLDLFEPDILSYENKMMFLFQIVNN